jgi:hypothetical protein
MRLMPPWAGLLVPLAVAAAGIVIVRVALGFQFPVPWPDETGFVAPAFDLYRTGSFFDPGMNPDRVVMWMPPGYMVFLAMVFHLLGYSYAIARWVSTVCCLACLMLMAWLGFRLTRGWRRLWLMWLIGGVFLAPQILIDSNIARMEMLFCCLALLALAALIQGRLVAAAAAVMLAGTVHFNAVYFAAALVIVVGLRILRRRATPPVAYEWWVLGASAAAVLAYGAQVAENWAGFLADMQFQFSVKHLSGQDDPWHPMWPVYCGYALTVWALVRGSAAGGTVALFGLAFLVMAHEGHELWYDYAQPLGFLLITMGLLAGATGERNVLSGLIATSLALVMAVRVSTAMAPLLPDAAMFHRDVVSPQAIAKLRGFIATLHPGDTVNFGWSGMELFFLNDLARVGAHWTMIRHSVTQVFPFRHYDWRVRCDSSEWPAYLLKFDIDYPRLGHDTGCDIIRIPAAPAR